MDRPNISQSPNIPSKSSTVAVGSATPDPILSSKQQNGQNNSDSFRHRKSFGTSKSDVSPVTQLEIVTRAALQSNLSPQRVCFVSVAVLYLRKMISLLTVSPTFNKYLFQVPQTLCSISRTNQN